MPKGGTFGIITKKQSEPVARTSSDHFAFGNALLDYSSVAGASAASSTGRSTWLGIVA